MDQKLWENKVLIYREGDYAYVRFLSMDYYSLDRFINRPENKALKEQSRGISAKGWMISADTMLPVIKLLAERGFSMNIEGNEGLILGRQTQRTKNPSKKKPAKKKISTLREPIKGNTRQEIIEGRAYIRYYLLQDEFQGKSNFTKLKEENVRTLYKLYDKVFFDGQIARKLKEVGSPLDFEVTTSTVATTAGRCGRKKNTRTQQCNYIFSFPNGLYQKIFTNEAARKKPLDLAGWTCKDRLECLMIVFEHELIHLLMMVWGYDAKERSGPKKNIYSSHGKLFRCMLTYYFGHTEYKHTLLNNDPSLGPKLEKKNAVVGMQVQFFSSKHKSIITGTIKKINPANAVLDTERGFLNVPWSMIRKMKTQ